MTKNIHWGGIKSFFVFMLFLLSIGIVVLAALPFINMVSDTEDYLNAALAAMQLIRLAEFSYLNGEIELMIWVLGTLLLDAVCILVKKYQSIFM
jgi:hypothetical protein